MSDSLSIRASPLPEEENEFVILAQSESAPSAIKTNRPTLESVARLVSTTKTQHQPEPLSSTENDIGATGITPISIPAMDSNVTAVPSEMTKTNTNSSAHPEENVNHAILKHQSGYINEPVEQPPLYLPVRKFDIC
ncbi:hypothetical protein WA026_020814 [Henosepilachna vigintioctopunctata]|uniref:Uncharacterized protein n=1 Tax=Henosepilachna vigintioctopunctata TaxID=420089 RepID=A0AAW1TRX3_9CUCU